MNEPIPPVVLTDEDRTNLWRYIDETGADLERGSVQNGGLWLGLIRNQTGMIPDLPLGVMVVATNTYGQREEHWFPRFEAAEMWFMSAEVGEGDE